MVARFEPKVSERLVLAVVLSVCIHFVVLLVFQARPMNPGSSSPAVITATIERAASNEEFVDPPKEPAEAEAPAPAPTDAVTVPPEPAPAENKPNPLIAESAPAQSKPSEPQPALEIPVIRDPTYYAARFLDEYPRPLSPVEPRYPVQAARDAVTGKVTLLLLIDENGVVNEISVVEANPEAIFDEAALAAFRGVRFAPARKDGRAVRSRVLITVGFESAHNAISPP